MSAVTGTRTARTMRSCAATTSCQGAFSPSAIAQVPGQRRRWWSRPRRSPPPRTGGRSWRPRRSAAAAAARDARGGRRPPIVFAGPACMLASLRRTASCLLHKRRRPLAIALLPCKTTGRAGEGVMIVRSIDVACRAGVAGGGGASRARRPAQGQAGARLRFLQRPRRADLPEEEGGLHPLRGVPFGDPTISSSSSRCHPARRPGPTNSPARTSRRCRSWSIPASRW